MSHNEIIVRTDLIDPHSYLDFLIKYRSVLERIKTIFNGYISQHHFIEVFSDLYNKNTLKLTILRGLIEEKWIGSVNLGKHKILYLKRKATICLSGNSKNGDLNIPSVRQVIRSLLIAELYIQGIEGFYHYDDDVYAIYEDDNVVHLAVLDITKRTHIEYRQLLDSLVLHDYLIDKNIQSITFYSYSPNRYSSLKKYINYQKVQDFMILHPIYVKTECINLLRFFNEKEPVT